MSANAMETAARFVQQLAIDLNTGSMELPMFPDSVVRIQKVFQAQEVNIDEVIQIISSEPAFAARVLQLANSSALRAAADISDVRQAVIRMGNKLVQSSVVAFAIRQIEQNETLTDSSPVALKEIWDESVELAAHCHLIAKHYTKLNPDEALLTGLLSVIGRLYIYMKSRDYEDIEYAELQTILVDWHPAISKAIAEDWGMSEELLNALETQLDPDPPLRESASLAEVLSVAIIILRHESSATPLDAGAYPLLQRLGIANHTEGPVTLDEHAEEIERIRQGLRG